MLCCYNKERNEHQCAPYSTGEEHPRHKAQSGVEFKVQCKLKSSRAGRPSVFHFFVKHLIFGIHTCLHEPLSNKLQNIFVYLCIHIQTISLLLINYIKKSYNVMWFNNMMHLGSYVGVVLLYNLITWIYRYNVSFRTMYIIKCTGSVQCLHVGERHWFDLLSQGMSWLHLATWGRYDPSNPV